YIDRLNVVSLPAGLDLYGRPEDRDQVEAIVAATRPDIVGIGPLYKMGSGEPTEEAPAKAVAMFLDRLRTEYGFALLTEAHTPWGSQGGKRPTRPYGASLWARWP